MLATNVVANVAEKRTSLLPHRRTKGIKMICKIYSASVKTSNGVVEEQFFSPKAKVCPTKRWEACLLSKGDI